MLTVTLRNTGCLALKGDLTLDEIERAEKALFPPLAKGEPLLLDLSGIDTLDTAGASFLVCLKRSHPQTACQGLKSGQKDFLAFIEKAQPAPRPAPPAPSPRLIRSLEHLGKRSEEIYALSKSLVAFIGATAIFLPKSFRRFRFDAFARHIQETGIDALPIVSLVAFLISLVLAYQGAFQLRIFGAETFTVNLVAVSVLREMGVLLTAIMVAGRSGSAFTAEIGVMKVTEEVDALAMIGIEPFDILVIPRLLALLITLPLLTFIADAVGLLGGCVTSAFLIDIPWQQYWEQARGAVQFSDFGVGLLKAPVFALIIALIGCKLGLDVKGSAESVGTLTTRSVVESIFMVLIADAFFSVLFAQIGW